MTATVGCSAMSIRVGLCHPSATCAPLLTTGSIVDAVWRRLLERAGPRPGVPLTHEPDLHLLVDGKRVDALEWRDDGYVFRLPIKPRQRSHVLTRRGATGTRRGTRSAHARCGSAAYCPRASRRQRAVEASHDALTDGYHAYEPENGMRWTDGNAEASNVIVCWHELAPDFSCCILAPREHGIRTTGARGERPDTESVPAMQFKFFRTGARLRYTRMPHRLARRGPSRLSCPVPHRCRRNSPQFLCCTWSKKPVIACSRLSSVTTPKSVPLTTGSPCSGASSQVKRTRSWWLSTSPVRRKR